MEWLKIIELLSRNWLVVLCLVICLPIFKITIKGAIDVHIAKISNKNRVVFHFKNSETAQSLEIHSNNLSVKDLTKHLESFNAKNLNNDVLLIKDKVS